MIITALLILSLTFYQNTYTYESGIVRYETGKTYVLCQDSFDTSCPFVTDKTLKKTGGREKAAYGEKEITSAKPGIHRKITLPIIEDMKKIKFLQKEIDSLKRDSIHTDSVAYSPSKKKKKVSSSPFAVEPQGYYEPDKQEEFLAKLEEEKSADKKVLIISRAEVHFMVDDQGLYIGSADTQMLEAMREHYRGHLMRFEGYGLNENEAQWIILSVMEILEPGEIQEIQAYRDEGKRLVIIEVLNEI